ncbi:DNA-directed RNA polymerase I subunit RPA49 [Porites harrisoni]
MATARLEYVQSDSSSCGVKPFIVHFTNANLRYGKKDNKKIKFACYRWADHTDEKKKKRRTLIAETDKMEYVGQNFGESARSNTLCRYVLGVYNSRTEVMKMYDTEMITLQPKVLVDTELNHTEGEQDNKMELSYIEKNDLLTEAFGSSKKKRAMASRLRNKIDNTGLDDTVTEVVQALANEPMDKTDGIEEQYSSIPPFNASAATPADVYKLDDIITPLEYEVLQKKSLELKNADRDTINIWRNQRRFPEYILRHLEVMSVNPSQRLHQSCCLLYLSYMITLYGLNYQDLKKKDPLYGMPDIIQKKLLSMFSLQKGKFRAIPKRLKDKLVSYILVLALMIDEYTLECSVIMKDLGMSDSRLTAHMKAIGCVVRSSKGQRKRKLDDEKDSTPSSKTASLEIPLPPDFQNSTNR